MVAMRSLLFVPGNRERMLEKALSTEADVLLLDLEDAVPSGEKLAARRAIAALLGRLGGQADRRQLTFARVNSGQQALADDLDAVVRLGLDGLVVPKAEEPTALLELERRLEALEASRELPARLRLLPIVETARGLLTAPAIAASTSRVVGLMFGGEDFSADLGLPARREREASELLYARSVVAVAAAAARVRAIDTIWPAVDDPAGLLAEAELARRLGFSGKGLIHPNQIDLANRVFSPSPDEIEDALRVVAAAEAAERDGRGALALDGRFVDKPIVERAQRTLTIARTIGMIPPG